MIQASSSGARTIGCRPGRGRRVAGAVHPGGVREVVVAVLVRLRDRAGAGDLQVVGDDRGDTGLTEDQFGPLLGVVRVDRDVGRAGLQGAEDRDVQVVVAGRDPDADPVARADAEVGQPAGELGDLAEQFAVAEATLPSSSAGSSGWLTAVACRMSTKVRSGGALSPRRKVTGG